jgi:hypothetical protein
VGAPRDFGYIDDVTQIPLHPGAPESGPPGFQSFAAQALHYFRRDHEAVPRDPVRGPAAWQGAALARQPEAWTRTLGADEIEELDAARRAVRARGLALGAIRREDFPLPALAPAIASWSRELLDGRGFLLLRGLPVARWGDEDSALVYWGLGRHLGQPGAQNPEGELLGHVVDTHEEAKNPNVRRYRTRGEIRFHCDLADAVGLLCLRTSPTGGASRITSSVSVFNAILERRPDLTERLFEPFLLDSRDEERAGARPYFPVPACRYARGRLATFWHSDYFRSVVRHAGVAPFTAQERELLDLYEELAGSEALRLEMRFQPGDVQLISNHTVVHARTAYQDDPGSERHLLRLWLSLAR